MAVRKNTAKKVEEVKVEEPVVAEVEEEVSEEPVVEIPETNGEVTVDSDIKLEEENIPDEPEKKVKIRMRVDHNFTVAMVNYDLKKDKCYDVPKDVRRILSEAGLLAPL